MNIFRRRQKTRLNKKRVRDITRGRSRGRSKAWRKKRNSDKTTEKKQKYIVKK